MSAPALPKISIVTPNYNYGQFLEGTLLSVLGQDYSNVEYIVIDDGSTDQSVEIIRRHEHRLAHWETGPNEGQYRSIARGLNRSTGEVFGWLNSDDAYVPGALSIVGDIFARFPEIEWLTTLFPLHMDVHGRVIRADHARGFNREGFRAGEYLPEPNAFSFGHIQQESTFWRRSLWEKAGRSFDAEFPLAGDFALWAKFYEHAELDGVATPLGCFRIHHVQRSAVGASRYVEEAARALEKYGGRRAVPWQKPLREIATRAPVAGHAMLEKVGAMRRARAVRWDLIAGEWKLEEYFI